MKVGDRKNKRKGGDKPRFQDNNELPEAKYFFDRLRNMQTAIENNGVNAEVTAEAIKHLLEKGMVKKFRHRHDLYPAFERLLLTPITGGEQNKMVTAVKEAFDRALLSNSLIAGFFYNELYFNSRDKDHPVIQRIMAVIKPVKWDPHHKKERPVAA